MAQLVSSSVKEVTMTEKLIHLIDDDPLVRQALTLSLQSAHFKVVNYALASDFIENMDEATEGCVLVDLMMPEMNGAQLEWRIREAGSNLPVIVMTGNANHPDAQSLRARGVTVLEKPFRRDELIEAVESILI